jgi:hypothetical protein
MSGVFSWPPIRRAPVVDVGAIFNGPGDGRSSTTESSPVLILGSMRFDRSMRIYDGPRALVATDWRLGSSSDESERRFPEP